MQDLLGIPMQLAVRKVPDLPKRSDIRPYLWVQLAQILIRGPIANNPRPGKMEQVAWRWAAEKARKDGVERACVIRVPVVHDDVCFLGFGGEEVRAIVVAFHNGDAGIEGCEEFGDAAEEHGDGVLGVGCCEGVENGAADVACSAGAGRCELRFPDV
jgi:hypothetical protein